MAVKKAKEASFKKMDSAFATSQSAIQKVKNTDPLNGNEEQEQGNENVSIDPAHYLSKKEKKEWKRLSYTAKQRYIRQAERQLKRQKKRNGIAKTEPSSVQEKEKQAAKIFSKERKYQSSTWKEPVDKKEIGSHGGNGEIASKSRDSRAAIRSQSTVAGGEKAVDIASSSTSAETAKAAGNAATKTVDTAAASTGAGLAALVAKKTAENFKEMLQQKNTAIESQRIKTQTKLSQIIEENKTGAGSPGVAAAAMLASVVVTVMYFAVQIAVTIFFVLLILLIPIIVIVSFLGIIITLLSGFAAAVDNTDYASGSGASIVAVAVQEIGYHEGAGNHTKYGVYTGTDGMSWCHAFVSWCANECGFIESNIIPKTAACETGRQWFIHKQQYLLEKQNALLAKEKQLMNRRSSLRSVEDKEMLRQYRALKKRLSDTPDWDDRFEIYQEELNMFLKQIPEGMLKAGEERQQINAILREIRHEKRIVNRIVEEERSLNKEQKISKTERTEIRHRR